MRVTIISDDSLVLVDGVPFTVDCSALLPEIHAVQWDGAAGEIEFKAVDGHKRPNEPIEDIAPFQPLIDLWTIERDKPPLSPSGPPAPPPSVLSQDLMAQFTAADAAKIQAAVTANPAFWLLWSAMQAQKDPMEVGNARFLVGWSAMVAVLGQVRMNQIAVALGVNSLVA
jgi:hypothetical protein